MLNRRNLRVKVMQCLYAGKQDATAGLPDLKIQLRRSIANTGRSWLYQYVFLQEIAHLVDVDAGIKATKHLPTEADLQFSSKFSELKFFRCLENHTEFKKRVSAEKLSPLVDPEIVRLLYQNLKKDPEYQTFLNTEDTSSKSEKKIIERCFEAILWPDEHFEQHIEEHFATWEDDIEPVAHRCRQLLRHYNSESDDCGLDFSTELERESREFAEFLLSKSFEKRNEFDNLIGPHLRNWELERISVMDMVLMEMALTELIHMNNIPVKVTINEYIDISKGYSSPKSREFINGVLDSLMRQLRQDGKIVKKGRGLVE